jgi:DNA-binding beta-propeller fold protein YncE
MASPARPLIAAAVCLPAAALALAGGHGGGNPRQAGPAVRAVAVASPARPSWPARGYRGVPVPPGTVSVTPDAGQAGLYALQASGLVSKIDLVTGEVVAKFLVGGTGISIALSPDGRTLYVLRRAGRRADIAMVDTASETVRGVLPAPGGRGQLLVSATGRTLYELIGSTGLTAARLKNRGNA